MLTAQQINKMSTKEIVAKIAKLTKVSKIELSTLTRDELKVALTNMVSHPEDTAAVNCFDMVLFFIYGDDGADEDVIAATADYEESSENKLNDEDKLMFELHPEEKNVGRPSQFEDAKLRKAFRHHARKIARKAGKCWEKHDEDYIVDGQLISWVEYVKEHSA